LPKISVFWTHVKSSFSNIHWSIYEHDIRSDEKSYIKKVNMSSNINHSQCYSLRKNLKYLRSRDCYYVKADKGNQIVIIKKEHYDVQMQYLIDEGPYEKIQSYPLEDANEAHRCCKWSGNFENEGTWFSEKKLMNTNYSIPIYKFIYDNFMTFYLSNLS
jgi:hypothetical protein